MKKIVTTVFAAILMFALTACGSTQEASNDGDSTITITHVKGEAVVPSEVKKAVVFDFGILDIMDALQVDVELGVPVDSLPAYLSSYETAQNLGGIKEPDMEAIHEFAPDVIIISGRQEDSYEELNKIAPTIYVDVTAANYMDDVTKNIEMVGQIFGKEDEAKTAITDLNKTIEDAQALVKDSEEKALIILTNDGSISVYGKGSRFGIIHDVLGIKASDEAIDDSTHGQSINFEYISEKNPDVLYVVDRTIVVGGTNLAGQTLNNDLVNGTNAAKNDKIVYLTPDYWYLSGGGITSVTEMVKEAIAPFQK